MAKEILQARDSHRESGCSKNAPDFSGGVAVIRSNASEDRVIAKRQGVLDHLFSLLAYKLILIEAPAGYGKTHALAQWVDILHKEGVEICWLSGELPSSLSLRNSDALEQHASPEAGASNDRDRECASGTSEARRVFIIDGYVSDRRDDKQLSRLIDELKVGEQLVLSVRSKPKISWAKRFAAGEAARVGTDLLRFSPQEADCVLSGRLKAIPGIASLEDVLRGWPAAYGFLVARLANDDCPANIEDCIKRLLRDLESYFSEEVYDDLPRELQTFAAALSLVPHFSADLAVRLTRRDDASEALRDLIDRNLFIEERTDYAGRRHTYEFPPLFRKFLQKRIEQRGEATVRDLHRRAADWYTSNDDLASAAYHCAQADDVDSAASIIENGGGVRIGMREGMPSLEHYLKQIPASARHDFPRIELAHVYYLMKSGRIQEAVDRLETYRNRRSDPRQEPSQEFVETELEQDFWIVDRFVDIFSDRPITASEQRNIEQLLNATPSSDLFSLSFFNILLYFCYFRQGDLEEAKRSAEKCKIWCDDLSAYYWSFYTELHLGSVHLLQGNIERAQSCFDNALHIAEEFLPTEPALQIECRTFLAAALLEANDVDAADAHIRGLLNVIDMMEGWFDFLAVGFTTAAAVRAEMDGLLPALAILKQASRIAEKRRIPRLKIMVNLKAADLCSLHRKTSQATSFLDSLGSDQAYSRTDQQEEFTWRERIQYEIVRSRLLLQSGEPGRAIASLEQISAECEQRNWRYFTLKARALCALALEADGQSEKAIEHILDVCDDCIASGPMRLITEEGPAMQRLLKMAIRERGLATMSEEKISFVAQLLMALNRSAKAHTAPDHSPIFTLREREIIDALSKENSNKHIARILDIEENTVKFHLKNIYEKLGVNRREMVAALAQKLSLTKE